ncbi:MAG: hypothetical protein ACO1Q7_02950 [Gemmatimonas sp.]
MSVVTVPPKFQVVIALALTLCTACAGRPSAPSLPVPSAMISSDSARFVFPSRLEASFQWPPRQGDVESARYYGWSVRWDADEQDTIPTKGIKVSLNDSLQVRTGALSKLLLNAHIAVEELFIYRTPPGVRRLRDPELQGKAVSVSTERNAVVITVRGRAAVSRLFSPVPDSVDLWGVHDDNAVTVGVQKRP